MSHTKREKLKLLNRIRRVRGHLAFSGFRALLQAADDVAQHLGKVRALRDFADDARSADIAVNHGQFRRGR